MAEQQPTQPPSQTPSDDEKGFPWKLVLWGVVALYAVIFLLVNSDRRDVDFVFFTVRTRMIWLILLSMALGAALGWLGPRFWRGRRRR